MTRELSGRAVGEGRAARPEPGSPTAPRLAERGLRSPHVRSAAVSGGAVGRGPQPRFLLGRTGRAAAPSVSKLSWGIRGRVRGRESPRLRGGPGRRSGGRPAGVFGAPAFPGSGGRAFRGPPCRGGRPPPADGAMWPSRGHKMPAADMAAAPLLPRPAEELKMAAPRKCGAERNARQRRKRRPSGNAARAGTPPPVAAGSSSFSWRYIILLP